MNSHQSAHVTPLPPPPVSHTDWEVTNTDRRDAAVLPVCSDRWRVPHRGHMTPCNVTVSDNKYD